MGKNVCFKCRQPGHMAQDCPTLRAAPTQTVGGSNARVFNVSQSQAEANPSAVTDQLQFHSIPLYSLIDSGATHSFIACGVIKRLGLEPSRVGQYLDSGPRCYKWYQSGLQTSVRMVTTNEDVGPPKEGS